jgi:hypothetical protein
MPPVPITSGDALVVDLRALSPGMGPLGLLSEKRFNFSNFCAHGPAHFRVFTCPQAVPVITIPAAPRTTPSRWHRRAFRTLPVLPQRPACMGDRPGSLPHTGAP